MAKGVKLSSGAAAKTAKAVRYIEQLRRDRTAGHKRPSQILSKSLVPFRLYETLQPHGSALAIVLNDCDACEFSNPDDPFYIAVYDLVDIMAPQIEPDSTAESVTPREDADTGTCGWARSTGTYDDSGYPIYSIVSLGGDGCVESGSEASASSASSSAAASEESGSDKSTAIVPASWSPTGYTGLHVVEAPGVPFVDLAADMRIPQLDTSMPIDPHFVEVCERGMIRVSGYSIDLPVLVGVSIRGTDIVVRFDQQRPETTVELSIQLWAARRGFGTWRFPNRTREQFLANERFIRSAYPGA